MAYISMIMEFHIGARKSMIFHTEMVIFNPQGILIGKKLCNLSFQRLIWRQKIVSIFQNMISYILLCLLKMGLSLDETSKIMYLEDFLGGFKICLFKKLHNQNYPNLSIHKLISVHWQNILSIQYLQIFLFGSTLQF